MAGGFGRNSFVGWAEESAWGTGVAASKYAELVAESLNVGRLRTPRPVYRGLDSRESQRYDEKFGGEGGFTIEANYNGMLKLLEHAFGDSSGVTTGAGPAYTHTFTLKDTIKTGKGLSLHINTDVDNGSTPQRRYTGFKINSMKWSFDPKRNAQVEIAGAAKDYTSIAATSPTFPAIANYMAGHQTVVKIDTVARNVDLVELTLDNGLDLDKRILGSKNIAEPERSNTRRKVSGQLTADAIAADLTKYDAGTYFQLDVVATGAALGGGNFSFTLTALKCLVTADPFHVQGPGRVKATIPFECDLPISGELLTAVMITDEATIA